jgi:hypothetical protein
MVLTLATNLSLQGGIMEPSRQPITRAVETEHFYGCTATVTEDKQIPRHRVLLKFLPTACGKSVDPAAEVDGVASQQNIKLWDKLNHLISAAQKITAE